jgi:hypothetical protein
MMPSKEFLTDFVSMQQGLSKVSGRVVEIAEAQVASEQPGMRIIWRPSGQNCAIIFGEAAHA